MRYGIFPYFQIKSNEIYLWHKNTDTNERSKTKSNVPTWHKGSKELHQLSLISLEKVVESSFKFYHRRSFGHGRPQYISELIWIRALDADSGHSTHSYFCFNCRIDLNYHILFGYKLWPWPKFRLALGYDRYPVLMFILHASKHWKNCGDTGWQHRGKGWSSGCGRGALSANPTQESSNVAKKF